MDQKQTEEEKKRDEGIMRFLDNCPDFCVPAMNGLRMDEKPSPLVISWSRPGTGFGQVVFYYNDDSPILHCENEGMSKEFIKERLCKMVDDAVLEDTPRK